MREVKQFEQTSMSRQEYDAYFRTMQKCDKCDGKMEPLNVQGDSYIRDLLRERTAKGATINNVLICRMCNRLHIVTSRPQYKGVSVNVTADGLEVHEIG